MKRCFYYAFLVLGILTCKTASAFDYSVVPIQTIHDEGLTNLQSQDFTEGQKKTLADSMMAAAEPKETLEAIGSGSFFKNLGGNFVGLFTMRNLPPLMAASVITGASHGFDAQVESYFVENPSSGIGNVGDFLGGPAFIYPVVGTLFFFGHNSHNTKFRCLTYSLLQGVIVNYVVTQ